MDEAGIIAVARQLVSLQAIVAAQGELISRLLALIARSEEYPGGALARPKLDKETLGYAAAVLPADEASERLLTVLAAKAEAKRSIFELAERMLITQSR